MKLATVWLILWCFVGSLALIGSVTAQRKQRPKSDYKYGPTSVPPSQTNPVRGLAHPDTNLTRSKTPILQSTGKRSFPDWKVVSLSEELEPVVGVESGVHELVSAVGKQAPVTPATVAPSTNATTTPDEKSDSFRSYMVRPGETFQNMPLFFSSPSPDFPRIQFASKRQIW